MYIYTYVERTTVIEQGFKIAIYIYKLDDKKDNRYHIFTRDEERRLHNSSSSRNQSQRIR